MPHGGKMKRRFTEPYRIFVGVRQGDLDRLFSRVKEKTFKKGEVVAREGEAYPENPSVYIIQKGEVSLIKKDSEGKSRKIGVMEEGNTFGMENLMGKLSGLTTYPLTYETSQNTEVHILTDEDLKQTLSKEGYTTVALNMTRYLSRWMRACLEECATVEVIRGYLRV